MYKNASPKQLRIYIEKHYTPSEQSYSLKSKKWRYIRYANGKEELYDVNKDPKEWNNLATCHVKMGGGRMLWGDEEALNSDSERYVTWNWCSINDGVQVEEVIKEHARLVELVKEDPQGMLELADRAAADALDQFRHL